MNLFGNIIWLIFGGLMAALGYLLGGIVLCITVIGVPWGLQCFKLAGLVLWPFGKKVISDSDNMGCLNIFLISSGSCVVVCIPAIVHIVMGAILCLTIIGIPWETTFQTYRNLSYAFWQEDHL